jgi:hypothetical protein
MRLLEASERGCSGIDGLDGKLQFLLALRLSWRGRKNVHVEIRIHRTNDISQLTAMVILHTSE